MNNKAHLKPKDYDSNGDIIPMSMEEEKGDLISRKALRKTVCAKFGNSNLTDAFNDIIDNAPSVPLPDFKEGYKQAIIDGKTNYSRQKGEWADHNTCPFCNHTYDWEYNFCPNCGADMRGAV